VIEPTDEMIVAFEDAYDYPGITGGDTRAGLAAVLALVESDYDVTRKRAATPSPFGPIVDPCTGCGCAKAWHGPHGCTGDFTHCPCETWMPLEPSTPGCERREPKP
jgi:hypothetical protein